MGREKVHGSLQTWIRMCTLSKSGFFDILCFIIIMHSTTVSNWILSYAFSGVRDPTRSQHCALLVTVGQLTLFPFGIHFSHRLCSEKKFCVCEHCLRSVRFWQGALAASALPACLCANAYISVAAHIISHSYASHSPISCSLPFWFSLLAWLPLLLPLPLSYSRLR